MSSSSDEDLHYLSVISIVLSKKKSRKRKSVWVRDWISRRPLCGAYNALLQELEVEDPRALKNFLRMDQANFQMLLTRMSPYIQKKSTMMRDSIPAGEKLALTLRFLASGDSYGSLEFLYRIPRNTICQFIPEVCEAIYHVLHNDYLQVNGSGKGSGNDPITGHFYVFVDNLCPECQQGSLDFALDGDGRWAIQMQAVQCPVGNTKIQYSFQGSHQWYIKLQIRNHRIPITSLRLYQPKLQEWTPLKHSADGYWELDPAQHWLKPIEAPLKVELTAANGYVMKDSIDRIENGLAIAGSVQVPYDSSLPNAE